MSNPTYREIERKFLVTNQIDLQELGILVEATLLWANRPYKSIPKCETTDTYWLPPAESNIQFARVRDSIGTEAGGEYRMLKELTIKQKDHGHNFDRLEINLKVDSAATAAALVSRLVGTAPHGEIRKTESIWFVEDTRGELVISAALIDGDLYFEVEGATDEQVREYCDLFSSKFNLVPEPKSFFELFVNVKKGAKVFYV